MGSFAVDPTWTDKDSKVERFRKLYEDFDFLDAYAAHTDLRVADNPCGAIGRADEWETHGTLQRDFLIAQGLKPSSRLLDLGCGSGRLARVMTPYLSVGHYTGADISANALGHAKRLATEEGWARYQPNFVLVDGTMDALRGPFDLAWAHSVFTHLPPETIDSVFAGLRSMLAPWARFFFTYKCGDSPQRTGLKQWRYPFAFFRANAERHGWVAREVATVWPASQRTGVIEPR